MNVPSLFSEKRKTEGSSRRVFSRLQITFEAESLFSFLSFFPLLSPLFFYFSAPPACQYTSLFVPLSLSLFSNLFSLFIRFTSFYSLLYCFHLYNRLIFSNNWKIKVNKRFLFVCVQFRVTIPRNYLGNFPLSKIDRVRKLGGEFSRTFEFKI